VKEIFDKCWELRASGQDLMIFNQFEELGNPLWHYVVTGSAAEEALQTHLKPGDHVAGFVEVRARPARWAPATTSSGGSPEPSWP